MSNGGKILFLSHQENPEEPQPLGGGSVEAPSPDAEATLAALVRTLYEQESDPVSRLAGFLTSDDPTYLPEETEARALARRVGRDKLLETLIELYVRDHPVSDQSDPQSGL